MAILKGVSRHKRSETLSGGLMVDTVRGVLRVRKWPRKYGKPRSALQAWWCDWFRQANLMTKFADAASQRRAIQITKDSGMYPRDIMLAAMRGRLYTWQDQYGKVWYPMAAIQDISESLDVLGQTVGDILVRATDRWRPPPTGIAGDVLTNQGPGNPPDWQPAAGGGGFLGACIAQLTGDQTISTGTWTPIVWAAEIYDTAGIHDIVTNPSRFTVPVGFTMVQPVANIAWQGTNTGYRISQWWKNGSSLPGTPKVTVVPTTSYGPAVNLTSLPLECVPGDYFELVVIQNKGSNVKVLANDASWAGLNLIA